MNRILGRILPSTVLLTLIVALILPGLAGQRTVHSSAPLAPIASFPPPRSEFIAQPESIDPTYPGDVVSILFGWSTWVGPGEDITFTVTVDYPFPHVEFLSATAGDYVDSCTHDPDAHTVVCTGTFPRQDPAQPLTGNFVLSTESTCGLYDNPLPDLVYTGEVVFGDGSSAGDTEVVPVAPILDLTVLAATPLDGAKDVFIASGGQGPLLRYYDYMGGYVCGPYPFPEFSDIYYNTYIRQVGGEWRFLTGWWDCTRQVPLGPTDLTCLPDGAPAPYEWRVDAVDVKYEPCRDPATNIFHFTTGSCRPELKVKPQFGNYFLSGLGVDNLYRVDVDWNGSAYADPPTYPYGRVSFDLNGAVTEVPGQLWGAEHPYNMGSSFQASLTGGDNVLRIAAINAESVESQPVVLQPMVFPLPEWITQFALGDFEIDLQAMTVKYAREIEYPDPHFEAKCHVPDWVPYLGGADMGILDTYAAVGAEACSDGSGAISLKGQTGAQLTEDKKVSGGLSGVGNVQLGPPAGLDLTGATFALNIGGEVAEEMGLADLIPGLRAAEQWWLVGGLVKWFNNRATVQAAIGPRVEIEAKFKDVNDHLQFDTGTGTGLIDLSLTLTLRVLESLQASVTGGGTPRVVIQVPAQGPWGYLREIAIDLYVKATITVWRFEDEWKRGITCSLPAGECVAGEDKGWAAGPNWRLLDRSYAGPGYAAFVGNAPPVQVQPAMPAVRSASLEMPLVSDVFPLANPALAVRDDGHRLVLWVHDDPTKPLAQGEEIRAAYWNGSTWISDSLTADNLQDFAPQVAFDTDGDAVAIWERTNTVQISPTLDITYVQSFDIAWAEWDGAGWSAPLALTANDLLDTSPKLERAQDGTLLALWRTGDGHDLLGTGAHPITLTYAVWDGGAWSAPATAADNLSGILDVDLAVYSADQAGLVLARDGDGDPLTGADVELWYATWDGTAWSELTALTTDAITDSVPALAYSNSGQPVVLWLHGPDLVMQTGWAGSPTPVRPDSTSGAFLDYDLLAAPNDNLALVWQAFSGEGADVGYTVYDAANGSWGADNRLMSDASLEETLAPAFSADGDLYMAYEKVAMEWVTVTYEISPTTVITVPHIPQPLQTDLYLLSHAVERDLGIGGDDLVVSDTNPAPGSSTVVSATVRNLGDLAVTGGTVAFYDGDPDAGGTPIGTPQALISTLRSAMTDTVSVPWNVPAGSNPHTLYVVVDPTNSIPEADEGNNVAARLAVLPDLTAAWAHSTHTSEIITLTAAIVNTGHVPVATPFVVDFRAPDPAGGELLGTVGVTSGLDIGQQHTVTLVLTEPWTLAGTVTRFWAVADSTGVVTEADEDNNADYGALQVLPDLTLTAADIVGGGPVVVTVHNSGVLTATEVGLAVWKYVFGETPVYSGSLGSLAPGACIAYTLTQPVGQAELWVKVDPANTLAESDEGNNLAVRPGIRMRIYLPLIVRRVNSR